MGIFNSLVGEISEIAFQLEIKRQHLIRDQMPSDLSGIYAKKLENASTEFIKKYIKKNEMGCVRSFGFIGGPFFIVWYETVVQTDGNKVIFCTILPSYRKGYLEAEIWKLRRKNIRCSEIFEISMNGEVFIPTIDDLK